MFRDASHEVLVPTFNICAARWFPPFDRALLGIGFTIGRSESASNVLLSFQFGKKVRDWLQPTPPVMPASWSRNGLVSCRDNPTRPGHHFIRELAGLARAKIINLARKYTQSCSQHLAMAFAGN
jgi:hypothetical protein